MITLNLPLNSTSLGASAFHILENLDCDYNLFPIGGVDLRSFEPFSHDLQGKIGVSLQRAAESHSIENPVFKLWHHFSSIERVSKRQLLYTFHEVDSLTKTEVNALQQQEGIIVPCQYNKRVFEKCGVTKPIYIVPLGVDRDIFYPMEKYKNKTGPYIFAMAGKFEARKLHLEILQAFVAIFGNNPNVKLRCCISNRFIDMNAVYKGIKEKIFQNRQVNNVEFIDWLPTERHFADFLCHADCFISPSRAESFNLPLLQAMSCGTKVITNIDHAHADYANSDNAIIVNSENMIPAKDDIFFRMDGRTNTGNWYNISPNSIAQAMISAFNSGRGVNINGIETSKNYSWKNTTNEIVKIWDSLMT